MCVTVDVCPLFHAPSKHAKVSVFCVFHSQNCLLKCIWSEHWNIHSNFIRFLTSALIERTKKQRETKLMNWVLQWLYVAVSSERSCSDLSGRSVYVCLYLPFTKHGTVRHSEQVNPFPGIRTKWEILSVIILLRIDIHRSLLVLQFFI